MQSLPFRPFRPSFPDEFSIQDPGRGLAKRSPELHLRGLHRAGGWYVWQVEFEGGGRRPL